MKIDIRYCKALYRIFLLSSINMRLKKALKCALHVVFVSEFIIFWLLDFTVGAISDYILLFLLRCIFDIFRSWHNCSCMSEQLICAFVVSLCMCFCICKMLV